MTRKRAKSSRKSKLIHQQLLAVLLRRRWWFLGTCLGIMSLSSLIGFISTPTYQSKLKLLVELPKQDLHREKLIASKPKLLQSWSRNQLESEYATQLNLLHSSLLIDQALNLLPQEYQNLDLSQIDEQLKLNQVVTNSVGTRIFEVVYTDDNPDKTQQFLAALTKVYQEYQQQQFESSSNQDTKLIKQQSPVVKPAVNKASITLGLATREKNSSEVQGLATGIQAVIDDIEQERQHLYHQYQATQSFARVIQHQLGLTSQDTLIKSVLSQYPHYQQLVKDIQDTDWAITQGRAKISTADSNIQQLTLQRNQQNQQLEQQVEAVFQQFSIRSNYQVVGDGKYSKTNSSLLEQLIDAHKELITLSVKEQSLAVSGQKLQAQLNSLIDLESSVADSTQNHSSSQPEALTPPQLTWKVVETAQLGEQITPNFKSNVLLGTLVGLFLGLIVAVIREALDDTLYTVDELKHNLRLPLLGVVEDLPPMRFGNGWLKLPWHQSQNITPHLLSSIQRQSCQESLDLIYKKLQLFNPTRVLKSLAITSALPSEGKSTLALGLALSAARSHQRVLLMDANLRQPSLHQHLNLPNEQGLSTLLSHDTHLPPGDYPGPMPHVWLSTFQDEDNLGKSSLGANVDVLTAGPMVQDPVKLLNSRRMQELMATFEDHYDLVIVDTPAILGTVDALQTASICDGVVMIGHLGKINQSSLWSALATLSRLNLIGLVANRVRNSQQTNHQSFYFPTSAMVN